MGYVEREGDRVIIQPAGLRIIAAPEFARAIADEIYRLTNQIETEKLEQIYGSRKGRLYCPVCGKYCHQINCGTDGLVTCNHCREEKEEEEKPKRLYCLNKGSGPVCTQLREIKQHQSLPTIAMDKLKRKIIANKWSIHKVGTKTSPINNGARLNPQRQR